MVIYLAGLTSISEDLLEVCEIEGASIWQRIRIVVIPLLTPATVVVVALSVINSLKGFEIRVLGQAPRAGRFAGFSQNRMVWFAFLLAGGLAGLAGISEVSGSVNQLTPIVSPGYGFTAIIVAFLGRLNPIGIFFSGFLLALSYLGGEAAQVGLGISDKTTRVFQGMLLFYVLACDTLILYRVRFGRPSATGRGN